MSPHVLGRPPFGRSAAEHRARLSAMSRAVSPFESLMDASTSSSRRRLHAFRWPLTEAQCNAVLPQASRASTSSIAFFIGDFDFDFFVVFVVVCAVSCVVRTSMTEDDAPARAATCRHVCRSESTATSERTAASASLCCVIKSHTAGRSSSAVTRRIGVMLSGRSV